MNGEYKRVNIMLNEDDTAWLLDIIQKKYSEEFNDREIDSLVRNRHLVILNTISGIDRKLRKGY